jgi:glucose/arabinose dehydrogenase
MRCRGCLALLSLAIGLSIAPGAATANPRLTAVASFSYPTYVTAPPGDSQRVFVVERAGRVKVIKNGSVLADPFLDISSKVDETGPGGLLSMAFAPDYSKSGRFYVLYTDTGGIRISEFRSSNNRDKAKPGERLVLSLPHSTYRDHYGGQLQFGRDGLLYVSIGDGGRSPDAGDPQRNAQNLGVLWGKLLRIDPRPSSTAGYRVPSNNPFVRVAGARGEIWAYGLRNPWRFSFDRSTGDLTIGDVGQTARDEVDFAPASSGGGRGANFGWSCFEGTLTYNSCSAPGHVPPVLEREIPTTSPDWCSASITGGYVVRDASAPSLAGRYVYGDFCSGEIRSAQLTTPTATGDTSTGLSLPRTQLVSFGEDASGHVYVAALASPGMVYRLEG